VLPLPILGWALLAVAGVGVAYALAAAELTAAHLRRVEPAPADYPALTVLKPLHGAAPGLREDLETLCRQDYPGPLQIVFGVQDHADPAIGVVEAIRAAHLALDIALVVDPTVYGHNRKVSNLVNMMRAARHDVLVQSDADIAVPPGYLRRLAASLAAPGVGAATCLYVGRRRSRGAWAALSALGVDQHFLPNVLLALRLGMAEPCFGSTIALPRRVLEQIGGFQAFNDYLADDYEIGRAVRRQGWHIAMPPFVVEHACAEATAREFFTHEFRWGRTVRLLDPAGFVGLIVTNPLPLALLGALLVERPAGWVVASAALLARLYLGERVARATGGRAGPPWLTPWRDIVTLIIYLGSFNASYVQWGGARFRVDPRGAMIPRDGPHQPG